MAKGSFTPSGLFVAMVTPMRPDESIDLDSLGRLAKHLSEQDGVSALVASARVGEGPVQTVPEQLEVLRTTVAASGNTQVVASISPTTAREALEMIENVAEAGADAVMLFPPLFFAWGAGVPEKIKTTFWQDIDAGSPAIPLELFQVPIPAYWYKPDTIVEIGQLESVKAIKEASFDMQLFSATMEKLEAAGWPIQMLNGNDRFVAEGALMGSAGALIGISNVLPSQWAQVLSLAGDPVAALAKQRELRPLQRLIFDEPILDAVARCKVVLHHEGVIDHRTVRRPQLGLTDAQAAELIRGYEELKANLTS